LHHDQVKYEEFKLLSLLAEDSEYAFQLIYDRYRNRIYHIAIRYLKSPGMGQEVVQDVFLKLWFERKHLKPDRPIEAWLYTVAKNNILNRLKKVANEWKALDQMAHFTVTAVSLASEKIEHSEYRQVLIKAIESLPEKQQKVFHLARQEGLTYIQIGERLHISPLTVKTHMTRALHQIRSFLQNQGIEFPLSIFLLIFFSGLYSASLV
jgi:RNA polymerase sigma-70 factor (ECF subfamily)